MTAYVSKQFHFALLADAGIYLAGTLSRSANKSRTIQVRNSFRVCGEHLAMAPRSLANVYAGTAAAAPWETNQRTALPIDTCTALRSSPSTVAVFAASRAMRAAQCVLTHKSGTTPERAADHIEETDFPHELPATLRAWKPNEFALSEP